MKKIFALNLIIFLLFAPLFSAFGGTIYSEGVGIYTLVEVFRDVSVLLLRLLIFGTVGGIILGGIFIASSGGNPGKFDTGKKIVIYSIIGLIATLLAYEIEDWIMRITG